MGFSPAILLSHASNCRCPHVSSISFTKKTASNTWTAAFTLTRDGEAEGGARFVPDTLAPLHCQASHVHGRTDPRRGKHRHKQDEEPPKHGVWHGGAGHVPAENAGSVVGGGHAPTVPGANEEVEGSLALENIDDNNHLKDGKDQQIGAERGNGREALHNVNLIIIRLGFRVVTIIPVAHADWLGTTGKVRAR